LQPDPSNEIRLFVRKYAIDNGLSFYDVRNHEGLLRNLIIRNTSAGAFMVILVIHHEDEMIWNGLLPALEENFPAITSLMLVLNDKKNDVINDLEVKRFSGGSFLVEKMASPRDGFAELEFEIGPVSFYQTNALQAERLYRAAFDMVQLKGDERVYDLYTGTGTIALYFARFVKEVIGIEYVEQAVKDAVRNAKRNQIDNVRFYAGDMAAVLDETFIAEQGKADLIITDPPRAGMQSKVVAQLLAIEAPRILYISCNPATQARDINMLNEKYKLIAVQPVDMFPQTQHVENIALLEFRTA
jgi:23S rRNA (uracil1939-C5)-methyltransferase